jgi:hypothetical protein
MEQLNTPDYIDKQELIYWIDKRFVQAAAKAKIGRSLDDMELYKFKKMIEFSLWDIVVDTIEIAIDEVTNENE